MGNEVKSISSQSCEVGLPLSKQPLSTELRLKKVLKAFVKALQRALPDKVFQSFYDSCFPIYKEIIRRGYQVRIPLFVLSGRSAKARMVSTISKIMPYTLVGIRGLEASYQIASFLNHAKIPGKFVELGVARGGCAGMLGILAFQGEEQVSRELWLFDSFEGLPDPTAEDFVAGETGEHVRPLPKGSCLGTLPQVKELLHSKLKLPADKIKYFQGWFQDTLPLNTAAIGQIALLRIDGDWYESTKVCLEYLYDKVVPGGAIVVDDYQSCYGCKRAVDQFLISRSISPSITLDGRGGCFFWKQS